MPAWGFPPLLPAEILLKQHQRPLPKILVLQETWLAPDIPAPLLDNYIGYSFPRPGQSSGPYRGGTAIYVSEALSNAAEIWQTEAPEGGEISWLRILVHSYQ